MWSSWSSDQKREWLRLHEVKGTWEKNLNQKCSDVWLKIQQHIPIHASTKPERKHQPQAPADPNKWLPSVDFPDEPIWPVMLEEKKRQFLKKHDIRGIWSKHLDMKCSELWRKTHQPAHETGHLTRKAAAARALAQAAATPSALEADRGALVPRDPSRALVPVEMSRDIAQLPPAIVTDGDRLANFPRQQIPALVELARASNINEITSLLNSTFSQVFEADRQKRSREREEPPTADDPGPLQSPPAKRQKVSEDTFARQMEEKNRTIEILTREVARLRDENDSLQAKHQTLLQQFASVTDVLKSIAQSSGTDPSASSSSFI